MSTSPDYTFLPNYGGRSMTPVAKPYRPWSTALEAVLLGLLFSFLIGLVLGFLGAVVALGGGLDDATDTGITTMAIFLVVAIQAVVVVFQAWYVGRRGGAHPVVASFAAAVTGVVAGMAASSLGPVSWLVSTIASVVVMAVISTPAGRR